MQAHVACGAMSQPASQRPLGPVVILASLVVLFGGAAYFVMTGGDDAPSPSPVPSAPAASTAEDPPPAPNDSTGPAPRGDVAVEPGDEEPTPSGPARAALPVPSAAVLALATSPTVTPAERSDDVLGTLQDHVGKFQACSAEWTARNPRTVGKAFFVFAISDEGQASNVSLQFKGLREATLDACLRNVLRSISFDGPAEKVFWPATIGGPSVFEPLSGSAP